MLRSIYNRDPTCCVGDKDFMSIEQANRITAED